MSRVSLRSCLPSVPQVRCAQTPWLRRWGFTHSDHVQGLAGQEWSAAVFVVICAKKDTACSNVSNLRRCAEGREVSGADGPRQSPQGPPLHTGEGAQGWPVNLEGGSSLPDWLTFQCHPRSRGASPRLLVTGVMLRAACPQPINLLQLWLQSSGGLEPRPHPHASKLDSTCSSGFTFNSSCSKDLGAEILSSLLAVPPTPTSTIFTFLNVLKTQANSELHFLC